MESEMNRLTSDPGSPAAGGNANQGSETFDGNKSGMQPAHSGATKALGETCDQALEYGRQNPGKTALIAFGIGIGVGMLLLGSSRRSRMSRYGEPIVHALSDIAMEFVRSL